MELETTLGPTRLTHIFVKSGSKKNLLTRDLFILNWFTDQLQNGYNSNKKRARTIILHTCP